MSATFSPLTLSSRLPVSTLRMSQEAAKSSFTWTNLAKNVALIAVLVGINKAGMPGNVLFYCILCFWALWSTQSAIKALSVGLLALVANVYFVEKSVAFSIGRFAIIGVCAGRVFFDLRNSGGFQQYRNAVITLGLFLGMAAIMSFITRYFFVVSMLKLVNFALGAFIIIGGVEVVRKRAGELTCWMISMACVVVLMGFWAMAVGQGSNFKEVPGAAISLFNGPFYHSQTLGPIGAMMVIYLMSVACFTPYKLRYICWPLIVSLFYFVLLTQSRTALVCCMGGLVVLGLVAYNFSNRPGVRVRFNISLGSIVGVGVVAVLALLILVGRDPGAAWGKISNFVVKGEANYGINVEDVMSSRQGQLNMMMYNIERLPVTGIGFGTSIDPYFVETATWFSAPTEKGNIILAVAEESGIPTAIVFWMFVFILYRTFWRMLSASAIAVFTCFLLANMGEMMFFAFGGHGAYAWLWVGAGMALGDRCLVAPQVIATPLIRDQRRRKLIK